MLTFEEFYEEFYAQDELSILEYTEYLINLLDQTNTELFDRFSRSSSDREWYYNSGISLPQRPRYGRFNFGLIQFGDILFEGAGGEGVTGHIAIIEGSFFDSRFNVNYWRVIEAIKGAGVSRGVLDDDRFVERKGQLLRVQSANIQARRGAVNFAIQQLGSRYCVLVIGRPTSVNQSRWHCAILVWAAYMNQGIDIEVNSSGGRGFNVGVTPRDIRGAAVTRGYLNFN